MRQQSITTLPPSPEAERRSRMIKYTIAMSIRVVCIVAMLFVDGWWLAVCAAGAIFLPYVAVVLANVSGPSNTQEVLRPGGLVSQRPIDQAAPSSDQPADKYRPDEHRPDEHRPDARRPDEHRPDEHRPDASGHDERGAA